MKLEEKLKAIELRRSGKSLKEICRTLGVSKGSVSMWVRDVILTDAQKLELDSRYDRQYRGAKRLKELAEIEHNKSKSIGRDRARKSEDFRLVCALYWGEGAKTSKKFAIGNSDPLLLKVVVRWLIRNGYKEKINFRVQYYGENGLSEDEISKWWLERLPGIELFHFRKFTKCLINRASQRKNIGKLPYGTANVTVNNIQLFYEVMGGIEFLGD
jgi:transposase-like protein